MTTVRLLRRQSDAPGRSPRLASSLSDSRVAKVTIQTTEPIQLPDGSQRIGKWTFPYAPNDITISNLSDAYEQLQRPGRLPIVERAARNPLQINISALVVKRTAASTAVDPIDDEIFLLRRISNSNVDLIIGGKLLGRLHHGIRFRMTDFSVDSVRRDAEQRMTIANVTLGLLQVHTKTQRVPGMIAVADIPASRRTSGPGAGLSSEGAQAAANRDLTDWLADNPNATVRSAFGFIGVS